MTPRGCRNSENGQFVFGQWCAWQELNLLPFGPEPNALSGELQARDGLCSLNCALRAPAHRDPRSERALRCMPVQHACGRQPCTHSDSSHFAHSGHPPVGGQSGGLEPVPRLRSDRRLHHQPRSIGCSAGGPSQRAMGTASNRRRDGRRHLPLHGKPGRVPGGAGSNVLHQIDRELRRCLRRPGAGRSRLGIRRFRFRATRVRTDLAWRDSRDRHWARPELVDLRPAALEDRLLAQVPLRRLCSGQQSRRRSVQSRHRSGGPSSDLTSILRRLRSHER